MATDKQREKAKQDLAKHQARMAQLEKEWAEAAGDSDAGRYARLSRAEEWVREGYGQDLLSSGLLGSNKSEADRNKFRKERLPNGKTREEVIHEYRDLRAKVEKITTVDYPDIVQDAQPDAATTMVDDQGRIVTKDPLTGKGTAYDPRTNTNLENFDIQGILDLEETGAGSKLRALTNDDLEDIFRTSNPDITPDLLSRLYPEYDAEGRQINEANPKAFSEAEMVTYESSPSMRSAWQAARQRELRSILGERRLAAGGGSGTALDTRPSIAQMRMGQLAPTSAAAVPDHGGRRGSPGQSAAINREATKRADLLSPKATTYSFREAFNLPFTWDKTKVAQMATRLFMAGYMPQLMDTYDPTKPLSEQYPGSLSDPYNMAFRGAYMQWMKDSMADRSKSSMEILAGREAATGEFFSEMRRIAEDEKAKDLAKRIASYTQLTDPDRINSLVDQLGQALIGRKLSPSEKASYVALIHSQESAYGQARAHAEVEGHSLSQTEVDVQSTLEAQVRADNPVETMGKDVADQYNEFRKLLGGPLAMM